MRLETIWQVEGILETTGAMHVGDGRTRKLPGADFEIQTVAKTFDGRARIPGSAVKGVLRSGFPNSDAEANEIFGVGPESSKSDGGRGGLAQFLDAYSEERLNWDSLTLARTKIDALTGAAQEHFLFQVEVVPANTRFEVRIRGKAFGQQRWQDAAALIDLGMRRFDEGGLRLGAGESNEWGRCNWLLKAVRVMDSAAGAAWLEDPEPLDAALGKLKDSSAEVALRQEPPLTRGEPLQIGLRFEGHPFLVNDPTRCGTQGAGKTAHAARRTADGKLLLPAESFRGVFAHQAERIARTRGKSGDRQPVRRDAGQALPRRDAVTRLFGAEGWGSPIEVSDFVESSQPNKKFPAEPYVQQFLAVDRFTGGGSEQRKFNAEGGWEPMLTGKITVNLKRLCAMGKLEPALGLLALTLRDLVEGDLAFGWGSGKGYGWARVETDGLDGRAWVEAKLSGWCPGEVKDWISAWENDNV